MVEPPVWKILISQIGSFSQVGMKFKKHWKPPSINHWFPLTTPYIKPLFLGVGGKWCQEFTPVSWGSNPFQISRNLRTESLGAAQFTQGFFTKWHQALKRGVVVIIEAMFNNGTWAHGWFQSWKSSDVIIFGTRSLFQTCVSFFGPMFKMAKLFAWNHLTKVGLHDRIP